MPAYVLQDARCLVELVQKGSLNPLRVLEQSSQHPKSCRCSACLVSAALWIGPNPKLTSDGLLDFRSWEEEEIEQIVGEEVILRWKEQISSGEYPIQKVFGDLDLLQLSWLLEID